LENAFDRVGDRRVFKTPSSNMAVAMANLDRLLDTLENALFREEIRSHLIAAMGQTSTSTNDSKAIQPRRWDLHEVVAVVNHSIQVIGIHPRSTQMMAAMVVAATAVTVAALTDKEAVVVLGTRIATSATT
jgi:hypothetical protein